MRIGIISRWNATCGVSMHAELIGREFLKMGNDLIVFAPFIQSANRWWHHKIIREDEDFVVRCYEELMPPDFTGGWFDVNAVLNEDLDLLVVESYESLPYKYVEEIVKRLRGKIVTIAVTHEGRREDIKYDLNLFDAVVVFDERYKREVVHGYQNVVVIPYPCHPIKTGNRRFAEDLLTFFSFGRQPVGEYYDFIRVLDDLASRYEFVYRVVRSDGLLPFSRKWLIQEQRRLTTEQVYEYLNSSDVHLIPKGNTRRVVVSSTLYQCLGALVPTIVPNTRHFEILPEIDGVKPAIVYKDLEDLKQKIIRVIEDEEFRREVINSAKRYVEENRSDKIASKFIKLFNVISCTA